MAGGGKTVILITGGSGSFGRAFIEKYHQVHKLVSLTNDEYQHWEIEKDFGIESIICDIRDHYYLMKAVEKVKPDFIIHAAALKHVPYGERFPDQFQMTNVVGSQNVADLPYKSILISTDKAVNPANVYGRTKQDAEMYFLDKSRSVIRFGNFWGSRGSVIPLWQEQAKKGYIEVTDLGMKRYFITFQEAVEFTMSCIENYKPKKIWTPEMKEWTLLELAKEVCRGVDIRVIGNRGNEKMREEL